jgi:hypothetical protein
MCEDNCVLLTTADVQGKGFVITLQDNDDSAISLFGFGADAQEPVDWETAGGNLSGEVPVTITEQGPNSGVFGTYDESDDSVILITDAAARGTSASIDYNETAATILVGFDFGTVDIQPVDDEWNSGEEIPVVIVDGDANKNSRFDEDMDLNDASVDLIPSLRTGDPFTLGEAGTETDTVAQVMYAEGPTITGTLDALADDSDTTTVTVQKFSDRAIITETDLAAYDTIVIDLETTVQDLRETLLDPADDFTGSNLLNIDVSGLTGEDLDVYLLTETTGTEILTAGLELGGATTTVATQIGDDVKEQSLNLIADATATALNGAGFADTDNVGLLITVADGTNFTPEADEAIVADIFSFGFIDDGAEDSERIQNQLLRIEAEETGDNTSTFEGSLEYVMVNQLNVDDPATYSGITPIADDPSFIVFEDRTDEDSPRVNYFDLGADGVSTQVADQQEAPSHSGVVSLDSDSYKIADTVTITLEDVDLNVDSDLIDIYTVVDDSDGDGTTDSNDAAYGTVGEAGSPTFNFGPLGRMLDVTFDDVLWATPRVGAIGAEADDTCLDALQAADITDTGLDATGFTLVETGPETGVFVGDFQIPSQWCRATDTSVDDNNDGIDLNATDDEFDWADAPETTTGLDIEVNYVDFRDASGEIIEVGDSAGVRANTGSVSLDRTVYPVPFGVIADFDGVSEAETAPTGRSLFPIHLTGIDDTTLDATGAVISAGEFIAAGDLSVHIRVNDPDFDISASGEDEIAEDTAAAPIGPVKLSVIRGAESVILGYAGGSSVEGVIQVGETSAESMEVAAGAGATIFAVDVDGDNTDADVNGIDEFEGAGSDDQIIRQFGAMEEIAPDAGIFEIDIVVRYTDGPADSQCPDTSAYTAINGAATAAVTDRFSIVDPSTNDYCILQGDILQVEYTDPADASGDLNTVTDSATFDLRNGVLQSDKSVYIIGGDMILTLIEPDFDLDNDQAETYDLDLIEWDSDAATVSMGDAGGEGTTFDPEPTDFRETGDSTGIFQIVIEVPEILENDRLERGEEIVLEYTDWGPSGSDYVGEEDEDVNVTVYTSNFGATVELDQKVYSWTDKVTLLLLPQTTISTVT